MLKFLIFSAVFMAFNVQAQENPAKPICELSIKKGDPKKVLSAADQKLLDECAMAAENDLKKCNEKMQKSLAGVVATSKVGLLKSIKVQKEMISCSLDVSSSSVSKYFK
jgi:hypothetical protein